MLTGVAAFRYDDLSGMPDWRDRLYWPIDHMQMVEIGRQVPERVLEFVASLTDDLDRQVAIVAAGQFAAGFMSLLECAWVCDRADAQGFEIAGGPPELAFLRDDKKPLQAQEYRGPFNVRAVPWARFRGWARAAAWTRPWKLPLTLIAPEAVALSHNALLTAAATAHRISFRHASNLLLSARQLGGAAELPMTDLAKRAFQALTPLAAMLRENFRERLQQAFVARLSNSLHRVAGDVLALRRTPVPRKAWTGTNGAYATRAIASEIIRRGGAVDAFDHGGVTGISQLSGSTALIELCTSTRFHLATQQWADITASTDALKLASLVNRCTLTGERGEPTFRQAFRDRKGRSARPRVIYIGHPYRGLRQFPIAAIADTVYWDFQVDLVENLQRLPIDLLCKPHPEGDFIGRGNPIVEFAPTSHRRFEEHLGDADIFLFDAPTSTTFLETLCTHQPVVLIDRFYRFNPAIEPQVRTRCSIVPARFDERNRLRVDADALAEAIMTASADCDPTYFRHLTCG
jgi:hypothetical protein